MKRVFLVIVLALFLISCGGNKPTPEWNASDYFKAAKEKFDDESYFEASNDFNVVLLRFAGSVVADSAQFYLAESHFKMGDYLIAGVEFEKLINDMNQSPLVKQSQMKLADSYYELSPRSALDQEYTLKSIREYQYFIDEFPTDTSKQTAEKRIFELRGKLSKKEWQNAEIYRKMKEFKAAIIYYDQVLSKYYDTDWADDSQYGKVITLIEAEDVEQANLEAVKFEEQFPDSELLEKLLDSKKEIKEMQDELAKNEKSE
ncbi:MAG: outer membrane protein assembly factor BamD [Calditrichaeota bacterium]|nr:outer membrane protein assembly factor BamD [Calditrichota bacterium]